MPTAFKPKPFQTNNFRLTAYKAPPPQKKTKSILKFCVLYTASFWVIIQKDAETLYIYIKNLP